MTDNKFTEYPCVYIDGVVHITITGFDCECGETYEYAEHPLLWRTLLEVTCRKCLIAIEKRHASEKEKEETL